MCVFKRSHFLQLEKEIKEEQEQIQRNSYGATVIAQEENKDSLDLGCWQQRQKKIDMKLTGFNSKLDYR